MKKIITVAFVLLSLNVNAYDGWSGSGKVDSVRIYSEDIVMITMSTAANPGLCSDQSYLMLKEASTESGKRKYSALLTAYTAQKSVDLALSGCSAGGTTGVPVIDQVWLM